MTTGITDVEWLDATVCQQDDEIKRLRAELDAALNAVFDASRRTAGSWAKKHAKVIADAIAKHSAEVR